MVVEDNIESLKTTSEVLLALRSMGLEGDVIRAKEGKKVRPGKGKMRGRRFKAPRGILIVVNDPQSALFIGAKNLAGVEIATAEKLNPGLLAPGGDAGRLTVFTESAIKKVGAW